MSPLVLWSLPFVAAAAFAIAAGMHYGAAARRQAKDLPNLPMAMMGGAVAGGLAVFLAMAAWHFLGLKPNCLPAGVILAGLAGEYLAGRVDDVYSALWRGTLCALFLFPVGAVFMLVIMGQVS
jgi:hypothetical protein